LWPERAAAIGGLRCRAILDRIAPGIRGFAPCADTARKCRRRIAPQRLGQCGVEIISHDAHVGQLMVLGVEEVGELPAMVDRNDGLPEPPHGGGDGLADQCEAPGARTHGALLSVALAGRDLGDGVLCDNSLLFTMADRKRTTSLDWEDLRYFVALARHGTLSATARELRVNHATVARRVASLETRLGRPLFDRRADGYAVTAEGRTVLEEAQAMDAAALSVLRRLDADTELTGLVRLAVGRVLAERFLIGRLRAFHEHYPAIDLEVTGGSRIVSLARREADIVLHYGAPKDSELIARRVAMIAFGLYASPAYRDELERGATPAFIGFDEESEFVAEAAWLARRSGERRFSFRTSSQTTQAAAARAGYGVALLPRYVAADDRGLVEVLPGERLPKRDVWLLIHRDLRKVPRVRAVADYLVEIFRRDRRLLEG